MENFNSGHRLSACSLMMLALGITKGYNENDYSQRKGNEQKTDKEWNSVDKTIGARARDTTCLLQTIHLQDTRKQER